MGGTTSLILLPAYANIQYIYAINASITTRGTSDWEEGIINGGGGCNVSEVLNSSARFCVHHRLAQPSCALSHECDQSSYKTVTRLLPTS